MGPYQRTPKLLELLDTQVEGSVQGVLLEISWKRGVIILKSVHVYVYKYVHIIYVCTAFIYNLE